MQVIIRRGMRIRAGAGTYLGVPAASRGYDQVLIRGGRNIDGYALEQELAGPGFFTPAWRGK